MTKKTNQNGKIKNFNFPASIDREKASVVIMALLSFLMISIIIILFAGRKHVKTGEHDKIESESYLSLDIIRDLNSRYYMNSAINKIESLQTNIKEIMETNIYLQKEIIKRPVYEKPLEIKSKKENNLNEGNLPDIISH